MVKLFFLGKDKRTEYLKKSYECEGKIEIVNSIEQAEYVIFPIPFTKDKIHITGEDILIEDIIKKCINKTIFSGGIPKDIRQQLEMNNIKYIDLMDSDEVAFLNAIPTAEGAIYKAIEYTDYTIHGANVLILGFGRCGKILANKLKGLNANVFCEARKPKDLAHIKALGYNVVELEKMTDILSQIDIIFSTIPTQILGKQELQLLKQDAVVIDLASAPGSIDYDECKSLNINAHLELGLPTKVAAKSAASYLKQEIDKVIYRRI